MTTAIAVFLGLTLTSAAAIVLFAANLRVVARDAKPFPKWALVPFATAVFSWRLGARALPVALAVTFFTYALLQTLVQLGAVS